MGVKNKDFGEFVRRELAKNNLTIIALEQKTGITRRALYNLLDGKTTETKISTLVKIALALNIHPVVLFRYFLKELDLSGFQTTNAKYHLDATGFVQDVTIPDYSTVTVDSRFVKTWEIQNIGEVAWIGRKLECMDRKTDLALLPSSIVMPEVERGLIPTQRFIDIPDTQPEEKIRLSVEFTAPSYPCTVISYWKMVDEVGDLCFPNHETIGLYCIVRVTSF